MAKTTLGAVGDISFAMQMQNHLRSQGTQFPFEHVVSELKKADVLFGNQESVMIPDDFPLEKTTGNPLQSRDFVLESLRPLGFDVMHMASNHVLDCGSRGLLHTEKCIRSIGAQPLAAGKNQEAARELRIVEKNGTTIGFLGYLQSGDWVLEGGGGRIAFLDLDDVTSDIAKYRDQVDVIVVSIHGDIEFQPAPSMPRLNLCRAIADAGPDLILCHHPHVPQGVETRGGCIIHYSLGNFLFDITGYQLDNTDNVSRSHIFYADIEDGKITGWRRRYFRLDREYGRPCPLSPAEQEDEEKYYRELDALLENPERLSELWHENCLRRLARTLERIRNESEISPMQFLHKYGKSLFGDMSHEYLDGLYEIARNDYLKHAYADFEYKRPHAAYD